MNRRDPLDRFPYEVWAKCICFAAYGETAGPLPFIFVSEEWRKSIIETPEAWTSIAIDNGEDIMARVGVLLHLSRNLPIDVHIFYPQICWDALRSILKHISRIRAIVVTRLHSTNSTVLSFRELLQALESGTPTYPQLEEYVVNGYEGQGDYGDYDFLWRSPKLVRVQFLLQLTAFHTDHVRKLTDTVVEFPVLITDEDETKPLDDAIHLTSPSIYNNQGSDKMQPKFGEKAKYIEKIHYQIWQDRQIDSFLSTTYPRLHSLSVSMPPTSLRAVIASIHLFPNIKTLKIDVQNRDLENISSPFTPHEGPRVYSFELENRYHRQSLDMEDLINDLAHIRILERARVLTFEPKPSIPLVPLLNLLRTAPQTQVLDISTAFDSWTTEIQQQVSLPSLEILKVHSLDEFWYIDAPNLQYLSVLNKPTRSDHKSGWKGEKLVSLSTDSKTFSDLRDHILQGEPKGQLFPSLTHVKWTDSHLDHGFHTTLLSSITHVSFNSQDLYQDRMVPIDAFCLNLLKYPEACPVLETIYSQEYPCWDLLLRILHLRGDKESVKSIQTVGLPGYPTAVLLELLTKFLNGGGRDIGMSGSIDEVIQKRLTIYGACLHCRLSGYTHCRQINPEETNMSSMNANFNIPDDLPLPTISALQRRGQTEVNRSKDWQWWRQLLEGRSSEYAQTPACSRHSRRLVDITKYSLSQVTFV